MNNLTKYSWWGKQNAPPPNLKTKKQLAEIGLAPIKSVGVIYTKKYDCLLYDVDNTESVRPKKLATDKQLKALEKARKEKQYKIWEKEKGKH